MDETPRRLNHVIFYGIIFIAVIGVIAILVLNLHTSDSALSVSYTATSTPLSDIGTTSEGSAGTSTASAASAAPSAPAAANESIQFEIVTTPAAQEQGLSDRPVIPDNYAMLFAFPEDGNYGFWMKDMDVPLDIIWLSDTGRVLGIEASLATSTYPNAVYPPQPVKYVLETKAGFMKEHDINIGDEFPDLPTLPQVSQ